MAWLLARLLDAAPEDPTVFTRRLWYRGHEHEDELPEKARDIPADSMVLVAGTVGHWSNIRGPMPSQTWPGSVPRHPDLHTRVTSHAWYRLRTSFDGIWMRDDHGRACENGAMYLDRDTRVEVLSYMGWRLRDLEGEELKFGMCQVEGTTIAVLAADDVDREFAPMVARDEPEIWLAERAPMDAPRPRRPAVPAVPLTATDETTGAARPRAQRKPRAVVSRQVFLPNFQPEPDSSD